jgi:ribosomal protein L24
MDHFSEGDEVVIRYGKQQGQKGVIVKTQAADVYRVKLEDGSVLFFCAKGMERKPVKSGVGRAVSIQR